MKGAYLDTQNKDKLRARVQKMVNFRLDLSVIFEYAKKIHYIEVGPREFCQVNFNESCFMPINHHGSQSLGHPEHYSQKFS